MLRIYRIIYLGITFAPAISIKWEDTKSVTPFSNRDKSNLRAYSARTFFRALRLFLKLDYI